MSELQELESEARAEPGPVVIPLVTDGGTTPITVLPPHLWFEGAVEALTAGRISDWVRLAVDDQVSLDEWAAARKRYRDLEAFVTAWSRATGETPGKSAAPGPSSPSTPTP